MKEPVVSNSPEPFGQDMLQDQVQKVLPFEGSMAGFSGTAFNILESHPAILVGNDILFADNPPV